MSCQIISEAVSDIGLVRHVKKKPPLSQCLGIPKDELMIEPHLYRIPYRVGDVIILCSDGLTDMVPPERTSEIIAADGTALDLVNEAIKYGGRDNVTVITNRVLGEES